MTQTLDCTKTLKYGDKGADVTLLQQNLQKIGYYLKSGGYDLVVDGSYGQYTKQAVQQFQRATGHDDDGVFGPKTCPDLNQKVLAKDGVSTTSTTSSSPSSSSSSSASKTTNTTTVKKQTEAVIDTSKNVYTTAQANLHIEGLHFIMSEITYTKPYKTGNWKTIELMKGNYNYLTKAEQLSFKVVTYLTNKGYAQMRSEIEKLETKVCNVVSNEITSGKYMISVEVAKQKKTHMKLTFTLTEYA